MPFPFGNAINAGFSVFVPKLFGMTSGVSFKAPDEGRGLIIFRFEPLQNSAAVAALIPILDTNLEIIDPPITSGAETPLEGTITSGYSSFRVPSVDLNDLLFLVEVSRSEGVNQFVDHNSGIHVPKGRTVTILATATNRDFQSSFAYAELLNHPT
jgi:hypothetical protein